jgi:hypothetical protein
MLPHTIATIRFALDQDGTLDPDRRTSILAGLDNMEPLMSASDVAAYLGFATSRALLQAVASGKLGLTPIRLSHTMVKFEAGEVRGLVQARKADAIRA